MLRRRLLQLLPVLLVLCFFSLLTPSSSRSPPYGLRVSCGSRNNIRTPPTNTFWHKDIDYTGGVPANATRFSFITPSLLTLRYFPLSEGPQNCYIINRVRTGHYLVRIYFGLVADPNFGSEPLFDVSIQGTLVESLEPGWSTQDNEQVFTEALVFITDGTASLCFHSTGHGDPAVVAFEILQIDDHAYRYGPKFGAGIILKTVKRLNCGSGKPKFDEDFSGDPWGGDRFWNSLSTFGGSADHRISTERPIKKASVAPNFYPEDIYKTALVSTDTELDVSYLIDVEPNHNYSIWLHFAEIDPSISGARKRTFDILINGDISFKSVDIVNMSGGVDTAFVLNTTVPVNGRTLTITLRPRSGSHAIIGAIEVLKILRAESKTLSNEVHALQSLKSSLQLPHRLGWNGDPCVPQQHPWSGADCNYDRGKGEWFIDGIGLDNQGLRGSLPRDISRLSHLLSLNLSGNSIHGTIPPSLGLVKSLEKLDLSYNSLNGSIPDSMGQLTSLRILNLNGNQLSGRVPSELGGRLLHRASFNFTDNDGLCGIPGLPACGILSTGAKIGITFAALVVLLLMVVCIFVWWKRRQNILKAQRVAAAREAPYAKKRTHFSKDVQMTYSNPRTATENGPILLS